MEENELFEQFKKEFAQLQGKPFSLAVAKQVAEDIIETLAPPGSTLRIVADRGWNPKYDENFPTWR